MSQNKLQAELEKALLSDLGEDPREMLESCEALAEFLPSTALALSNILDAVDDERIILESLQRSKTGMFATYSSIDEVHRYAIELLKSSSLQEREFAAITTMNIYHNTLLQLVMDNIKREN